MKLIFKTSKSPEFIYEYLTNVNKMVSIHPVITKMESKGGIRYKVYETLKLGFIPFSFTYPATVEGSTDGKSVVFCGTVMKMTTIEMKFAIFPDKEGTLIEENISVKSVLPIASLVEGIIQEQHGILFLNMGKV